MTHVIQPTRRRRRVLALACLLALAAAAAHAQVPAPGAPVPASKPASEYLLAPGDTIVVKFLHNAELNEQLPIRPDGRIALPIVGEVVAAGLSPAQLRSQLVQLYATQLKRPELVVMVQAFGTQRVYVGGEVGRPGEIAFIPGMTVLQAVILAGGDKLTAAKRNVVVVRDQGTETPQLLLVDLKRVVSQSDHVADLRLQPRDIVFVPMSKIAKVNTFVAQYIKDVLPISLVMGLYYNFGTFAQH